MSTSSKNNLTIVAAVILSLTLLLAGPAQARKQKGNKKQKHTPSAKVRKGHREDHKRYRPSARVRKGHRDNRHHKVSDDSLTIGFGWQSPSYCSSRSHWVSGHYETRTERVLVESAHYEWQRQRILVEPAHYEIRRIPAVERTFPDKHGKRHKVIIKPARTEKTWVPDRYETRRVKVWVPDRYETHQVRTWVPGYWATYRTRAPSRSWLNLGALFRFSF